MHWSVIYLISEWAIRLTMLVYVPRQRTAAAARACRITDRAPSSETNGPSVPRRFGADNRPDQASLPLGAT